MLSNGKISIRQFQILLILEIFGAGAMALPAKSAVYAGSDAWVVAVISSCFALICVLIITVLSRRFYKQSFFEYSSEILSKPLGIAVSVLFTLKLLITSGFTLRIFSEIIRYSLLNRTPVWVICAVLSGLSGYAASFGIEARARLAEILFLIVFLPMILVLALAARDVDYSNILPVFVTGSHSLLTGSLVNLASFTGIEFCLLSHIFINRPDTLPKSSAGAVAAAGVLFCFVTVLSVCAFGYEDIKHHIWPVYDLINTIRMPGGFIERQDTVSASFWIVSAFVTASAGIFYASGMSRGVLRRGKDYAHVVFSAVFAFAVSVFPEDLRQVYKAQEALHLSAGLFFMFALPFVMLVISRFRGLGDK